MAYGNCVYVSMVTSRVWLMAKFGSLPVESMVEYNIKISHIYIDCRSIRNLHHKHAKPAEN